MGSITDYAPSPDGKKIVYGVNYVSVKENKTHSVIYIMDCNGENNILLTDSDNNELSPCWNSKDSKIFFISDKSGNNQIWEMNPDGTERKQLSFFEKDIDSFKFSPDGLNVLFISQAPYIFRPDNLYKDLDKTTGLMANDLMYKHW